MALGSTLARTLTLTKTELKASLSAGEADDALFRQAIESAQESLAASFDWAELKDQWNASVAVGEAGRYITFPTQDVGGSQYSINFDRPLVLKVKYNDRWQEVCRGISSAEYDVFDSDDSEEQDPVQRWDLKPGDASKFEVWPLASSVQDLRFFGQRKLKTLRTGASLDDAKLLDLDDQLVALTVAIDWLEGSKAAALKIAKWQQRLSLLRGANVQRDEPFIMGSGSKILSRRQIRSVPLVITAP